MERIPDMPKSQNEWETHWLFYRLVVKERDYERQLNTLLREEIESLKKQYDKC